MSNEDEDRATEARKAINLLETELDKEKTEAEEKENRELMASRIAHLYEHHIHVSRFEGLMDRLYNFHQKPSVTGVMSVVLLLILGGLVLMMWNGTQASMPSSVSTASEPSSTVGSLIVDDAQGCMWWCLKRELLVTRVLRGGCECVDDKGETITMTWSFRQDKTDASNVKINFASCIERNRW